MNLLDLDEPDTSTVGGTPAVGRCVCGRKIWDPVSLAHQMGSGCRKKHGITTRGPRVRLARTRPGGDCEGQADLLEAAMPGYITTDGSDHYHAGEDCEAFQAGRRGSEALGYQLHEIRTVTAEQAETERKTPCPACVETAG